MIKKGDTLIEVTLAIGIFSMIAVAIAAVLGSSTSGAQTALEATMAREEIDTQAEVLRFIQSSYENNNNETESNGYATIWKKIKETAIPLTNDEEKNDKILKYAPASCGESYGEEFMEKAFVINPRKLSDSNGSAFVSGDSLRESSTYPRLVYSNDDSAQAEGIYVIAVGDQNTTEMVGGTKDNESAFYDFYIRSCWYGINSDEPSTVSTVIRLYNPDAVEVVQPKITVKVEPGNLSYKYDEEECGPFPPKEIKYGGKIRFPDASCFSIIDQVGDSDKVAYLLGWDTNPESTNPKYKSGETYEIKSANTLTLFPIWNETGLSYWVDLNTFIDKKDSNTSGREGFKADINITGSGGKIAKTDVIDFYEEVKLGANVEIVLKKVDGYRLSNQDSVCAGVKGCKVKLDQGNYRISFGVTPYSVSAELNSSNQYAINIEPIWVKE